ncbi:hypothetical protein PGT21_005888 [Puccinia graminis f. sp. tritici]|nr:hypothetical protein PGT21_005888 [Puccinia graminis f. sp. tritici]
MKPTVIPLEESASPSQQRSPAIPNGIITFALKKMQVHHPSQHTIYPHVNNIFDVVPRSFLEEVPVPENSSIVAPNSLRTIRHLGVSTPSFPDQPYPYQFTIPGNSLAEAEKFVQAMSETIRWNRSRKTDHSSTVEEAPNGPGKRPAVLFKLEYTCPRSGQLDRSPTSRKTHESIKCDCNAKFSISLHIKTNMLRVVWYWQHNHNPTSHTDMLVSRPPASVTKWLKDRVLSGLDWDTIEQLVNCSDIANLESDSVKPQGFAITYD